MGKAPSFQFYPGDWRRDTQVQMASMETRGVWIEMLCCMWDAPERGKLVGTQKQLCRLLHCDEDELQRSLEELQRLQIADVTNGHNDVTVVNRRMSREEKQRIDARLRKQKQREREASHKDVTPLSSSSTSIGCDECDKTVTFRTKKGRTLKGSHLEQFNQFWETFSYKSGKAEAGDAWYDLKVDEQVFALILHAARIEARTRPKLREKGQTPKMAQGWLSGRRFEDEQYQQDDEQWC